MGFFTNIGADPIKFIREHIHATCSVQQGGSLPSNKNLIYKYDLIILNDNDFEVVESVYDSFEDWKRRVHGLSSGSAYQETRRVIYSFNMLFEETQKEINNINCIEKTNRTIFDIYSLTIQNMETFSPIKICIAFKNLSPVYIFLPPKNFKI